MLQNSGKSVRAQYVESPEQLAKVLGDQAWDLLIAHDETQNVTTGDALKTIRKVNKDVPIVLLTDREGSFPIVEGMKAGAVDVVRLDEDQHLLLVIDRVLSNKQARDAMRVAEKKRLEAENNAQALLNSSRDGIAFIQDGMFLYVNDSFAELLEYDDKDDLDCMPVIDVVKEKHQNEVKRYLKEFVIKYADAGSVDVKFTCTTANSNDVVLSGQMKLGMYDEESAIQLSIPARSAENKELEAKIKQMKSRDTATGLHNKDFFVEKLEKAVEASSRHKYNSALMYVVPEDLVDIVSDKIGPTSIGEVMRQIGEKADNLIKQGDVLCRYSDDTLMILMSKIDSSSALSRAESFAHAMNEMIVDVDGSTLQFKFFIGVAAINETSDSSNTPLVQADEAVSQAREANKEDNGTFCALYKPDSSSGEGRDVAGMVQYALDNQQFKLLFQPILSLRGAEEEHYDVLLRMISPENELVSPGEFLKSAIDMGVANKIDRWVIIESVKALAVQLKERPKTRLIINISKTSLLDSSLPAWLGVAFKAGGVSSSSVIFQLNESDITDHLNAAKDFLEKLQKLGSQLAISRFGCGLNPLSILKHVDASYFKVDPSFTQELQSGTDETQALNELVSALHQNDKITIVPHVESASVLSKLWQTGVHYIQGYYLQGPSEKMDYDFDMES